MVSGRYDTEGDVLSVTTREPEWLSLKDVQQLLGIGRTKTYELVTVGELPAVRIGRCIRVNRTELDEWLRTQRYVDSIGHDAV
jgi:excisionase family DNA binding protein